MEEIWKEVVGYEGFYEVSNLGRAKSISRMSAHKYKRMVIGKILKPIINNTGYVRFHFCKNGNIKTMNGHRIVAEAFIENPENKPTINHKNGIRHDNRVENLEWNTVSENVQHSFSVLGKKSPKAWKGKFGIDHTSSKAVIQYGLDGLFIKKHNGLNEAERTTGVDHRRISRCCRGLLNKTGGYKWSYANKS